MKSHYDIVVVGGGIVGLATARELALRFPQRSIAVIEKEHEIATHQSGHNSGVIHTGIYYKPGSLKAQLCVAGHKAIMAYCEEKEIPFKLSGKLIVALNDDELPRLHTLYERGQQNGVAGLTLLGPERMQEIEPHVAGVQALWSPQTAVVDFRQIAFAYAADIQHHDGDITTGCTLTGITTAAHTSIVHTTLGDIEASLVITCAGLYSDHIAGETAHVRIVPFRGSYYTLSDNAKSLVNGLIYPVPDPRFPFLGVHFTRNIHAEVWVGPNAVLAFAREGYSRWKVNLQECFTTVTFPGFWRLAATYWQIGGQEMARDFIKRAYVRTAQAYIPALQPSDMLPGPAGVRAQALRRDGSLVDDFLIKRGDRTLHVQNAPSPAATSSLLIGKFIADEAAKLAM